MDNSNASMTSSQKQVDVIRIACSEFRKGLESSVPLRHFSQFHDEAMIRTAAAMEKRNAVKKLMEVIANDNLDDRALVNELYSEMDKVIDEFLSTNAGHRNQTEVFLKKEIDFECEKFKVSLEAKLNINPEMDLKTLEELLESGKLAVASYFGHHWNHGNVGFFQELKRNLNEKLDHLGQEMLKVQKDNLEDLEAEKFFEKVKAIVLEKSRQMKGYVDAMIAVEGEISKSVLKQRIQDLFDYLTGEGEVQNERHRKYYLHTLGTIMHAMKFLGENELSMRTEDLINWIEKLDERLKYYCTEKDDIQIQVDQDSSMILSTDNVSNEVSEAGFLENDGREIGLEMDASSEILYNGELVNRNVDDLPTSDTSVQNDVLVQQLSQQSNVLESGEVILNEIGVVSNMGEVGGKRSHQQDLAEENENVDLSVSLLGGNGSKMRVCELGSNGDDTLGNEMSQQTMKETADGRIEGSAGSIVHEFEEMADFRDERMLESEGSSSQEEKPILRGKHGRHLEKKAEEDAWNSVQEVKVLLMEMCKQIKSKIEAQETDSKKKTLMESVQSIHDYLTGMGSALNERYGKLYADLQEVLKDGMKCLTEEQEDMSVEDAKGWAKMLELQLKSSFSELEMQHDGKCYADYRQGGNGNFNDGIMPTDTNQNEESQEDLVLPKACMPIASITLEAPYNVTDVEGSNRNQDEVPILNANQKQTGTMVTTELVKDKVFLLGGAKRGHLEDMEVADEDETIGLHVAKRFKESSYQAGEPVNQSEPDLKVPDKDGQFPLLRAIREGQSAKCIKKMLDNGANVNIRMNSNRLKYNAAHEVILSLIYKKQTIQEALAILDLLVATGFRLINEKSTEGFTPLLLAMQYTDMNEELLTWFRKNGADFNAVDSKSNSVLFQAIHFRQKLEILQKILDFGGNVKHLTRFKWNVLHKSATRGNELALKLFVDQVDVNERTIHGYTPLHLLFLEEDLDYQECLEMLLKKKADFEAKDNKGYIPFVRWIKSGKGNFFPILTKLKDQLPITPDIASATLTVIVEEIERLQKYLPSPTRNTSNEFVEFILLLIEEKRGLLRLKDETKWKLYKWDDLKNVPLPRELSEKIGTISIETFLLSLLGCKNYSGFAEVCQSLKLFCVSVRAK